MEGIGVLSGNCHALWPNLCVPVPFSRVARLAAASGLQWDGTSQAFSLQNACVREQCVCLDCIKSPSESREPLPVQHSENCIVSSLTLFLE